jgi:AcrR family transcriptional regulator
MPRTQPAEVRRTQLLDAAAGVLVEKGASAMTVGEVAGRAGLAKGTVYLYFETKEDLVAGLQARYTAALVRAARALVDGPGPHLARLETFLRSMVDLHVSERELHHELFHGTGMRDDAALRELAALLRSFIEDGASAGAFTIDDPAFASEFLLHGLHGVLIAFVHEPRASKSRFVSSCLESARHLLGAA